ncbi:MAG: hypothetical protein V3R60_02045, partial [Acidobacteriota bacterium]
MHSSYSRNNFSRADLTKFQSVEISLPNVKLMNWVVKPVPNEDIERLADAVGVSPLLARLLL